MSDQRYINAAQQRILQMLQRLAGHEIEGIAPGELATALNTSASNVTRDLANLKEAGLADKLESGNWRLSPRTVQIALAAGAAFKRAADRLEEIRQRFTTER